MVNNPHMTEIPMNPEVTYFGRTNFRDSQQIFGIKRKDRRQHMYILGKSGTGKSVLISNMIVQNIWNGEGVCLVDPHGELVETVIKMVPEHRINDIVYFNPADTDFSVGFNPLEISDPKYKHLVASGLMGIFTKIWANVWSSRMEYILNNTILALLDTPNTTLLGVTRMLVDKEYRQTIVNNIKDPIVKAFWVHEYEQWKEQFRNEAISPIQNKVGQFLSSSIVRNIVGQTQSTIDIFKIMNEGKVLLVNVSKGRIGEDNAALLGAMIITKIQLAAMERVRIPEDERRDFYLYVDEFQNFATDSFANILSEARKYRLCLTLAHQYTAQIESGNANDLKDAVFGNVGTMIIFRVGSEDAQALEKEFAPELVPEDFVGLPNYKIYLKLMIDGITSRPFSANTLPPINIATSKDTTQTVIEASRKQYTKSKDYIETVINSVGSNNQEQKIISMKDKNGNMVETKLYSAVCQNCQKEISVPFEPKDGKPVYCKDCLQKIKIGEMKPAKGFYDKTLKDGPKPFDVLSSMGIEFTVPENKTMPKKQFTHTSSVVHKNKINVPTAASIIESKSLSHSNKSVQLKNQNKNDADFVSLKDLLNNLHSQEKSSMDSANQDKKQITKKTPVEKEIVQEIKKQPQETVEVKQEVKDFKNRIDTINKSEPTVLLHKLALNKSKVATTQAKDTLRHMATHIGKQDNQVKKDIEQLDTAQEIPIPEPPKNYQKNTPKAEVPEDILIKIFKGKDSVNQNVDTLTSDTHNE